MSLFGAPIYTALPLNKAYQRRTIIQPLPPEPLADELLQIIFEIMLGFVDMGLGIHPVQDCLLSTLDMATGSSDNTLQ